MTHEEFLQWGSWILVIVVQSGLLACLWRIAKHGLDSKYPGDARVATLERLADTAVRYVEQIYGDGKNDAANDEKYHQALGAIRRAAEATGIDLPNSDVLATFIEAAVQKLPDTLLPGQGTKIIADSDGGIA